MKNVPVKAGSVPVNVPVKRVGSDKAGHWEGIMYPAFAYFRAYIPERFVIYYYKRDISDIMEAIR
jgi:hypothetical protein